MVHIEAVPNHYNHEQFLVAFSHKTQQLIISAFGWIYWSWVVHSCGILHYGEFGLPQPDGGIILCTAWNKEHFTHGVWIILVVWPLLWRRQVSNHSIDRFQHFCCQLDSHIARLQGSPRCTKWRLWWRIACRYQQPDWIVSRWYCMLMRCTWRWQLWGENPCLSTTTATQLGRGLRYAGYTDIQGWRRWNGRLGRTERQG